MGLDIYWLDGGKEQAEPALSLSDSECSQLEIAFEVLYKKTGVDVDLYGTTRLSPDHVSLLLREIEGLNFLKVNSVLTVSVKDKKWMIVEGD